jgi:hypothetical protein
MMVLENELKTPAEATQQTDSAEPSITAPPTMLVPYEKEATATCVMPEVTAPASSQNETSNKERTCEVDRSLVRSWQQWTSVIDALASGRSPALDDVAYRALHRQLLDACKANAAQGDRTQAARFQRIAELVQPWLTLRVLDTIDRETLVSLRQQCYVISATLGYASDDSWKWAIGVLFLFLAATASYYLFQLVGNSASVQISAWMGLIQRNSFVFLAVLVPIVLITSVVMMKWLLRAMRRG